MTAINAMHGMIAFNAIISYVAFIVKYMRNESINQLQSIIIFILLCYDKYFKPCKHQNLVHN